MLIDKMCGCLKYCVLDSILPTPTCNLYYKNQKETKKAVKNSSCYKKKTMKTVETWLTLKAIFGI